MDPVTISYIIAAISAALGAAGTYSAGKASKMTAEQQYEALRADKFRQAELQRQADAKLRDEVSKFSPETAQQQVEQATAERVAATPVVAPTAAYQSAPATAPVDVKSESARRLGDVFAKAKTEASRRARLGAYGDVSMQQGFQLNRLGENFRQMGADSAGSSRIMGAQASLPNTGAEGWRNRSDIANILGQVGSLYAMGAGKKAPEERTDRIW